VTIDPRHLVQLARSTVPAMHPAGRPFVLGLAAAALVGRRFWRPAGPIGAAAAAACALFFRVPARVAPTRAGVVVAAADGLVSLVDEAAPPAELGLDAQPRPRVSVFLSVFDVHVQRTPVAGTVEAVVYRPGAFLSADLDKASEDNERNSMLLRTVDGHEVAAVQIAGLVARRIMCEARVGDKVEIGQTYGLIRFGSRVDVYLPPGATLLVTPGQRAIGGETVLGMLPATRPDGD
jgi:phosphatidylserine decarboxylase